MRGNTFSGTYWYWIEEIILPFAGFACAVLTAFAPLAIVLGVVAYFINRKELTP